MATVDSLTCERSSLCLGMDERNPRFCWKTHCAQRAYQLVVGTGTTIAWDSGWIESSECCAVYGGTPLEPRTRYWFRVRIRKASGEESEYSGTSWFESGLFPQPSWDSEWLKAPTPDGSAGHVFLNEFTIDQPVQAARAYVAGLGYHELRVNCRRSGSRVLDPAWTDYSRKICYVVHDVTDLIGPGRNIVAVMVGAGRYREPVLNFLLHLDFDDGSTRVVRTDHCRWWWSVASPVVRADLFDGERYDARIHVAGWDEPCDAASSLESTAGLARPLRAEPPGGLLVAQDVEPIRVVQDLAPISRSACGGGSTVYDLGQNIAGWARIRVRAAAGTEIRLLFSEALRDDGQVEMRMNREARATDCYVTGGSGTEEWEPRFTYHGFRYVQVESTAPLELFDLVGKVVRTDAAKVGTFRCADELVNRIRTACEWTEADNLHSLPTDCPQREERMGWLNDMTVRAESALYTFDLNLLYAKWSHDIALTQGEATGAITDVAPFDPHRGRHFGNRPADPVSSSYLLTVWLSYLQYGDRRTLERRYPGLLRWYRYLLDHAVDGILAYSYWGDWASPAQHTVPGGVGAGAASAITPGALVSTCYLFYDAWLLERMARVLGREAEAEGLGREAEGIRRAFNARFWDDAEQRYGTGSQGCQAIPLALGLATDDRLPCALDCLVRDIRARGTHLSTGNLATRYVLEVLADHGETDLAWALVTQRGYPSWGYMIDNGATTIWERWEHLRGTGMNSHNHPMYATVSGWLSKYIGGIRCSEEGPGFARLVVRPHVPRDLAWAEASLDTIRGLVRSRWTRVAGDRLEYRIAVPPSSTARLEIPAAVGDPPTEYGVVDAGGLGIPTIQREGRGARCAWDVGGGEFAIIMGKLPGVSDATRTSR